MPTQRGEAGYRTRIEVLRDFLRAVRQEPKKTRIIGLANLNPSSFRRYLEFGVALDLVRPAPGGYRLSPRAEVVLDTIERLLAKSSEFDTILGELYRSLGGTSADAGPRSTPPARKVSRVALGEIVLPSFGRSGGIMTPSDRYPVPGISLDPLEPWWSRDGGAPVISARLDSAEPRERTFLPPPVTVRRNSRARPRK